MKNNEKFRILFFIFLISASIPIFYWFEYRPAKIRQECSWKKISEENSLINKYFPVDDTSEKNGYRKTTLEEYSFCIKSKGINK